MMMDMRPVDRDARATVNDWFDLHRLGFADVLDPRKS